MVGKKVLVVLLCLLCFTGVIAWLTDILSSDHAECKYRISTSEYSYHFKITDARQLHDFFIFHTGSLQQIKINKNISPIFTRSLPRSLKSLDMEMKKELFIEILLPVITKVNLEIWQERCILSRLHNKIQQYRTLTWKEQAYLNLLKKKYMVNSNSTEELLSRVDTVPISLALAQGIIESGWGTSRFARHGNALYGVHRPSQSNDKHMKSLQGEAKVAAYNSILESTSHYIRLLNIGKAYAPLRAKRKRLRAEKQQVSGTILANTLGTYSEIGETYVQTIKSVISRNQLEQFNTVHFQQQEPIVHITINSRAAGYTNNLYL